MALLMETLQSFDEQTDPYANMSLHEMRQICDKHGLKYRPIARHIELATLLRGAAISQDFDIEQEKFANAKKIHIAQPSEEDKQQMEFEMRKTLAEMDPFAFMAWMKEAEIEVNGHLTAAKRNEIIDAYIDSMKA